MTISEKESNNSLDIQNIKQSILAIGGGGLDYWKSAAGTDKALFDLLYSLIFSDNRKLAWRSAWIIDNASEEFPDLLSEKLPEIIEGLLTTNNGSLKRHFSRILCRYQLPEQYLGAIVDRCFALLSPVEPIAVRVFAMQILFNITRDIPDLKGELVSVLENLLEEGGSAGFINRANKLLRILRK
jgi:hypothetical protein